MNNSTTKTTKTSAVFLATVLVAGIIGLSYPSFMTDAQAFPDYNNFKKSFGKDVSVKYIKCTNIDVNINGISVDINTLPGLLGGEVAAEAEASSFGGGSGGGNSDGPHDSDNKGFVFVCINNNNNGGADGGDQIAGCVGCFDLLASTIADEVADALQDPDGITIDDFTFISALPETATNEEVFEEFCEELVAFVQEEGPLSISIEDILGVLDQLNPTDEELESIIDFLECLIQERLIDLTATEDEIRNALSGTPSATP